MHACMHTREALSNRRPAREERNNDTKAQIRSHFSTYLLVRHAFCSCLAKAEEERDKRGLKKGKRNFKLVLPARELPRRFASQREINIYESLASPARCNERLGGIFSSSLLFAREDKCDAGGGSHFILFVMQKGSKELLSRSLLFSLPDRITDKVPEDRLADVRSRISR